MSSDDVRSRRRRWALAAAGLAALAAAVALLRPDASSDRDSAPAVAAAATRQAAPPPPGPGVPNTGAPIALTVQDVAFVDALRAKFAPHMADKHAQIKAIEQLVAYLMEHYPQDWRDRVLAFLRALFPERAGALFAQFEKLMHHNDWLRANREELMKLAPDARRAAIWQARRDAFGEDAAEIWAAEVRSDALRSTLAALESAPGKTLDEKLATYVGAVNAAFGEQAPELIESRGNELMNRFLDVQTVQDDLHAMAPMARREALRGVRQAMGLDEAALDRWDSLDVERDRAWDRGTQYMAQRQAILAEHEGAEADRRLGELQSQTFGDEAETIRNEEAGGFYRFQNRRRFGRE